MNKIQWLENEEYDNKITIIQEESIERIVHVRPPTPREAKAQTIQKLRKAVYGIADANHTWYLEIHEEFIILGANISKSDQAIFCFKEKGNLKGLAVCFVVEMF